MDKEMEFYTDVVKEGYEERVESFRTFLNKKAVNVGEDLMPIDIAEIMIKANSSGKYKYLLRNGFESIFGKLLLLFDIYEGCGFKVPSKELTRDNVDNYF